MNGSEDQAGEADDIPPELKPASAPDPRSLRPIATGIGMVMLSAATWQMSVAMEPAVVELWKQLLPVAPFGQLLPEFLMGPLSNLLAFEPMSSDLFIILNAGRQDSFLSERRRREQGGDTASVII